MLFILIQQNILIIYFLNDTTSLNGPDIFATYFLDYSDLVLLLGQYVIMHFFFPIWIRWDATLLSLMFPMFYWVYDIKKKKITEFCIYVCFTQHLKKVNLQFI